MSYQISREGQLYGPYTLEDLQRYVASGNVLGTDLAKSEDMPAWLPVSQLLVQSGATVPSAVPPMNYGAPVTYQTSANAYPDPPNLHWALLLLFGVLTCGLFTIVYDLIQTLWVKKVNPASKALLYYIVFIALEVLNLGGSAGRMALSTHGRSASFASASIGFTLLSTCISIGVFVMFIVYRFTMRSDLEQHFNGPDPVGLRLGGIMTFFFGGLYFQYHFNRINEIKKAMRYRGVAL